jgi:DNA-binding GntR family transcriptional regulator
VGIKEYDLMEPQVKNSISDKVYNGLRTSIIHLKWKPGEEIKVNLIAENLGVSRSPVRDALLELEKEGLVTILPQIGTRVSKIDMKRMHEERFLRESLEENTLALFMEMHTEEDLHKLHSVLLQQKKSLQADDVTAFLQLDDAFHKIIFEGADKKMCWQIIRNMSGHYRRVRLLNLRDPLIRENVLSEHTELYESICAGDSAKAKRAIKEHLSKIIVEEKELLQEFPDYFTPTDVRDIFAAQ